MTDQAQGSLHNAVETVPGVLTRSMASSMPNPPTYISLPDRQPKKASARASSPPTPEPVVSAYMASWSTAITISEIARRMEMQERFFRLSIENDQLKGMLTRAGIQHQAEEEEEAPPPQPQPNEASTSRQYYTMSPPQHFYPNQQQQEASPPCPNPTAGSLPLMPREELEGASGGRSLLPS